MSERRMLVAGELSYHIHGFDSQIADGC